MNLLQAIKMCAFVKNKLDFLNTYVIFKYNMHILLFFALLVRAFLLYSFKTEH